MKQSLAGRYQFEAEIARGAAGVVHRARDLVGGEMVAVKVLHTESAAEPTMAAAFLDEAEVLSELDHPGIVRPRDLIINGDLMALVMELVEGVDLRRSLNENGPMSPQRAATVVSELAQVLAVIHEAGIVHGDVKPGNIMLPSNGGPVRLIDFGVARRIASPDGPTHGTPDYAAPELINGEPSSAKTDVYGVGLVLFEALCGRNPYRGGPIDEVLARHRTSIPLRPEQVPSELWSIVESCLAGRPEARPAVESLPSMLRAVMPVLTDVAAPALAEPPVLRPRDEGPVLLPVGVGAPMEMTPPVAIDEADSIDAMFVSSEELLRKDEQKRGRGALILAGTAATIVAIAAIGFFALGGLSPDSGVVSEPKGVEESTSESPGIEETDTDSTPSQDPSEEPSDEEPEDDTSFDDSNSDGDTGGDSGDGSDSSGSDGDSRGEDLIGSPMPGGPGGN